MHDHIFYDQVVGFMQGVITADPDIVKYLVTSNKLLIYKEKELVFTLKGLHQYLLSRGCDVDYKTFRRLLYASDLNTRLAPYGYIISQAHTHHQHASTSLSKVDTNWYTLAPVVACP